ncbi:putative cadmium/zinc-transporting ATPase hma4 [Sarracenia purpurea var. burkii]
MGVDEKNKTSQKFQKSYFDVLGLCCSSEVALIEKLLKPLDGVKDVSIIVPSRTVIVLHDSNIISQVRIVKALNQARLEANVRVVGDAVDYRKKWPSPYAIGCGVLLLLSFLKYVYRPLEWLALAAVAVGIFPIFLKGIAALWNFTLDTNILALFAGNI